LKTDNLAKKQAIMHQNFFDKTKEAADNGFYLEAIFREYAAIEGRLEVMCGVLGLPCNKDLDDKKRKDIKISHRVECLKKIYNANSLYGKGRFDINYFDNLDEWLKKRNIYVHGLYKNVEKYDGRQNETVELANEGLELNEIIFIEVKRLRRWKKAGKLDGISSLCTTSRCGLRKELEAGK
jgi:hypothetical protein